MPGRRYSLPHKIFARCNYSFSHNMPAISLSARAKKTMSVQCQKIDFFWSLCKQRQVVRLRAHVPGKCSNSVLAVFQAGTRVFFWNTFRAKKFFAPNGLKTRFVMKKVDSVSKKILPHRGYPESQKLKFWVKQNFFLWGKKFFCAESTSIITKCVFRPFAAKKS